MMGSKWDGVSFWITYEGGFGKLDICAAMTEKVALEMIEKVLQTGLIPSLTLHKQNRKGERQELQRFHGLKEERRREEHATQA